MQAHLDVPEEFWQALYKGTVLWDDRSGASICRYALHELYVDLFVDTTGLQPPAEGPPKGTRHLQVKAQSPEEERRWEALIARYGSGSKALGVAVRHLHDSLYYVDPSQEPEPEPAKVTSKEVSQWRKKRAVSKKVQTGRGRA